MTKDTSRRSALACSTLGIFLTLIAVVHCVPIEIVYTGDSCDCQSKLDYAINIPKVPRQRKYSPNDYGYKIDVPVQAKAKVSYSFDFVVEEPKTPKPQPSSKWNLYAKVDRIAVNKPDCESSRPSACKCGGRPYPGYRYVYNRMPSRSNYVQKCQCNGDRAFNPYVNVNANLNAIANANAIAYANAIANANANVNANANAIDSAKLLYAFDNGHIVTGRRLKRDLYRKLFRPRKAANERTGRFVKLYSKNIQSGAMGNMFGLDAIMEPLDKNLNVKRKLRKAYFPRLVKRDIKGEYDLLEKDREQIDLTLPEIIQFMPETLQPSFKKGQCIFGKDCMKAVLVKPNTKTDYNKQNSEIISQKDNDGATEELNDMKSEAFAKNKQKKPIAKQNDLISFKKRNAGNYDYGIPLSAPATAKTASELKPTYGKMPPSSYANTANAYDTKQQSQQSQRASATLAEQPAMLQTLQPSPYEIDRLTATDKFAMPVEQYRLSSELPYESQEPPLRYVGNEKYDNYESDSATKLLMANERQALNTRYVHPVQHISNAQLDKIVSDIVYKHPDFVDATYHFGGALVDPEPLQEHQVRHFLKNLIDGRLNLWFKEEEAHTPLYYISSYDASSAPYNPYRSKSLPVA